MKNHAKTVVFLLSVSTPNIQVRPSRGSNVTTALIVTLYIFRETTTEGRRYMSLSGPWTATGCGTCHSDSLISCLHELWVMICLQTLSIMATNWLCTLPTPTCCQSPPPSWIVGFSCFSAEQKQQRVKI